MRFFIHSAAVAVGSATAFVAPRTRWFPQLLLSANLENLLQPIWWPKQWVHQFRLAGHTAVGGLWMRFFLTSAAVAVGSAAAFVAPTRWIPQLWLWANLQNLLSSIWWPKQWVHQLRLAGCPAVGGLWMRFSSPVF